MIYGYARVSTKGQARDGNSLEAQMEDLTQAGATEIFSESFTGTTKNRPELDKMLSRLCEGDLVVITKLDRIARNAKSGLEIIDSILSRGASIRILNMGTFDNSPIGKMMRTVLLAFAEFERDMIVQRTTEGKEIARQKEGYHEGRPRSETENFEYYVSRNADGIMSVDDCCSHLKISRSTWYNRIRERRKAK